MRRSVLKLGIYLLAISLLILFPLRYTFSQEDGEPVKGEARYELKVFSLRDVYRNLSDDMVLHEFKYSPYADKLVIFYYDYKRSKEMWAVLDPNTFQILSKGEFPYSRFKTGVLVREDKILSLSWKPKIALYLTDTRTGKSNLAYFREPGHRGYNFTLISPLIPVRGGALTYADLVDQEGFTLSLKFLFLRVERNEVKLEDWVSHEDISPKRHPLRSISFDYPRGLAFILDKKVCAYRLGSGGTGKLIEVRPLRYPGRIFDYKRDRLVGATSTGRYRGELFIYDLSGNAPELIAEHSFKSLGGVPLGAQWGGDRLVLEVYRSREISLLISDDYGKTFKAVKPKLKLKGATFSVSADGKRIFILGRENYYLIRLED